MPLNVLQKASDTSTHPDFPGNAWQAVAWDTDLKHALLARTTCNKPLVLYRTEPGKTVVLEDAY